MAYLLVGICKWYLLKKYGEIKLFLKLMVANSNVEL